jgi:hypothetical protein
VLGFILKTIAREVIKAGHEGNQKKQFEALQARQEDVIDRMCSGQTVDAIADEYERLHQIAPTQTLLMAAYFIHQLYHDDDPRLQAMAEQLSSIQTLDSVTGAADLIPRLNFTKTVYQADRCSACREGGDGKLEEGVMVLSRGYLYFFPYTESFSYAGARVKGYVEGGLERMIPGWGVVSTIWEVGSGVTEAAAGFFSIDRLVKLAAAFKKPAAFAVTLAKLSSFGSVVVDKSAYLRVAERDPDTKATRTYYFGPQSNERAGWISGWIDMIALACIGEGNLFRVTHPKTQA